MTTITPASRPFERRGKNPISESFTVSVSRFTATSVDLQVRLKYQLVTATLSLDEAERVAVALLAAIRNGGRDV